MGKAEGRKYLSYYKIISINKIRPNFRRYRCLKFFSLGDSQIRVERIITLTTDFGLKGYYVALLKGHILKANPHASIIDITHNVEAYDVMEASFYLKSTYRRFPKDTIHVVAVNAFYNTRNKLIALEHENFFFIGPNNGVFSLALNGVDTSSIVALADQDELDLYEVIENAIQGITVGSPLNLLGEPLEEFETKLNLRPVITSDQIRATIIYVDHFGNVIVNLSLSTFEKIRRNRNFAIYYKSKDPLNSLSRRFDNVPIGDTCAFFNSIGLLEIAVHMGNANQLLGLNKNETIHIDFY